LTLTLGVANTEEDLAEPRRVRALGGRQPFGLSSGPRLACIQRPLPSSAGSWHPSPPSHPPPQGRDPASST